MTRYIKNFILITSLLLVSCNGPVLPNTPKTGSEQPETVQTQKTIQVKDRVGKVLEIIDVANLTTVEKRTRKRL